jgi:hypothetical protein
VDYLCNFHVTAQSKVTHLAKIRTIWDRCYDFKSIFAEKFSKNIGGFAKTAASF